jgi:PAS domain S-box-containing protein
VEATLSPKDIDSAHSRLTDVPFVTVEGTHKRKNGTLFPVEIRLSKWIEGDSTWIISDVRDVTERKKAKEALNDELTTSATL